MEDLRIKTLKYANISRRSFLKGALAVGGALALAGCGETVTNTVTVTEKNTVTVTDKKTVTVTDVKTVTVTEQVPTVPTEQEWKNSMKPDPVKAITASKDQLISRPATIIPRYMDCVGCNKCMIACSMYHYNEPDMYKSNIQVYGVHYKGGLVDIPILCMKCKDAPCMAACPEKVGAISRDEVTGALKIDHEKCTLCELCIEACNADRTGCLKLSKEGDMVVGMCDHCGGTPECVLACPDNVLEIVGSNASADRLPQVGVAFALKPEELAKRVGMMIYGF